MLRRHDAPLVQRALRPKRNSSRRTKSKRSRPRDYKGTLLASSGNASVPLSAKPVSL